MGKAIEALAVNPALRGPAAAQGNDATGIRRSRDARDRVDAQGLGREARTAGELPLALVGLEHGAQLTHPPLVERHRASQLDIENFEPRRIRPAPSRGGKRHLENCCRRQNRHALDCMVSDPGKHLLVEMIEPACHPPFLAEPEERMIEGWIDEVGSFGCCSEPKSLPVPRVERKPTGIGGAVE